MDKVEQIDSLYNQPVSEDLVEVVAKIIRPILHSDWYPQDAYDEVTQRVAKSILSKTKPQIEAEERKKIEPLVEKLFEALSYADFSNGVGAFGMDEGRVRGYELVKELETRWVNLKQGKGVNDEP